MQCVAVEENLSAITRLLHRRRQGATPRKAHAPAHKLHVLILVPVLVPTRARPAAGVQTIPPIRHSQSLVLGSHRFAFARRLTLSFHFPRRRGPFLKNQLANTIDKSRLATSRSLELLRPRHSHSLPHAPTSLVKINRRRCRCRRAPHSPYLYKKQPQKVNSLGA